MSLSPRLIFMIQQSPVYNHMALQPCILRSLSKMRSCRQVVGANLPQTGKKPLQRAGRPSLATTLPKQSSMPEQIFCWAGWFMSLVLTMSKGVTVMAMQKPATKALMNQHSLPSCTPTDFTSPLASSYTLILVAFRIMALDTLAVNPRQRPPTPWLLSTSLKWWPSPSRPLPSLAIILVLSTSKGLPAMLPTAPAKEPDKNFWTNVLAPMTSLMGSQSPMRREEQAASLNQAAWMPLQKAMTPPSQAMIRTADMEEVQAQVERPASPEIYSLVFTVSTGWMKLTVSTAAIPALPTDCSTLCFFSAILIYCQYHSPQDLYLHLIIGVISHSTAYNLYTKHFCSINQCWIKGVYILQWPQSLQILWMSHSQHRHPLQSILSGGLTGGIEICITYPTEYVKTQLQLLSHQKQGIGEVIKHTYRQHGLRGFYRGLSALLLFSVPKTAVRFGSNSALKQNVFTDRASRVHTFLAGLGAGMTEAILVVTPAETLKVRLIDDKLSPRPKYRGLVHGISCIVEQQGWQGIYKGLGPTIVKQGSNQAVRFLVYEDAKKGLLSLGVLPEVVATLLAGGLAGLASVLANTPVDVIKTKMQGLESNQYRNSLDCLRQTVRRDGAMALYKGTVPRLSRVVADVAITFTLFEQINSRLDRLVARH